MLLPLGAGAVTLLRAHEAEFRRQGLVQQNEEKIRNSPQRNVGRRKTDTALGAALEPMTMHYATFSPSYGEVADYFDHVGAELGLGTASAARRSGDTPRRGVVQQPVAVCPIFMIGLIKP